MSFSRTEGFDRGGTLALTHQLHEMLQTLHAGDTLHQEPKGVHERIFILTKESHNNLHGTLTGTRTLSNITVKEFKLNDLIKYKDQQSLEELVSRIVILDQQKKTMGFMPQHAHPKEKIEAPAEPFHPVQPDTEFNVQVKRKQVGAPKQQAEVTTLGTLKAHQATQAEIALITTAIQVHIDNANAHPTDTTTSRASGPEKTPKLVAARTQSRRASREESKPASERKRKISETKNVDKGQETAIKQSQERKELRKAGERRREAAHEHEEHIVEQKNLHTDRITADDLHQEQRKKQRLH